MLKLVALVIPAFEAGMPVVGLVAGRLVSTAIGTLADLAAIGVLIALGLFMVLSRESHEAEQRLALLARSRGLSVLGFGIGVSIDELAIGFTLGLLNAPLLLAVVLIAVQAFVISQVGFSIGNRVGEAVQEGAERLAGVVLLLLGVGLAIGRLTGFQL